MSRTELNLAEATTLVKLAEKLVKECKDNGETLAPNSYPADFVVHVEGGVVRDPDTKALPPFKLSDLLKPLLLKYAESLGKERGREWLSQIMGIDGALGAVIQLGADSVLKTVDPTLAALWRDAEEQAKAKFQKITPKNDRAGSTTPYGIITRVNPPSVKVAGKKRPS